MSSLTLQWEAEEKAKKTKAAKKKKAGKGKEWDILRKHPTLAKQSYSKSAVNKMLSKDKKKD